MSKQITPVEAVRNTLKIMEPQFKAALPPQVSVKKFTRVAMTAIQNTPSLLNIDRKSLFGELIKCSQDGLLPNGEEAAIIPFKNQAKYMPMVKGILKKVRNSGELASITSQIVYKNDEFEFYVDEDGEHLKHRPNMFSDRGEIIGVYAIAKTKDGAFYVEVLSMADINSIKNMSKGKNTPWGGPFAGEMMRKSAIRRLSKRLPMSTDLEAVIKADDDMYELDEPAKKPEPKESKASRLEQLIDVEEPKDVTPEKEEPEVEAPI